MRTNVIFIAGVLVFIGAAWFSVGGSARTLSLFTAAPASAAPEASATLASAHASQGNAMTNELASADAMLSALVKQLSDAKAFGTPSPYRGLISIERNTNGVSQTDPKKQYVKIALSARATSDVTISGWSLVSSATGVSAVIPNGTETAKSGAVNEEAPIVLHPGDQALIATGASPIGVSFRENECSGYLGQFQEFSPALVNSCPLPSAELSSSSGDSSCASYLKSLPRCTIATAVPSSLSDSCAAIVYERINYNGCVATHGTDASFPRPVWRVFLSTQKELWQTAHETIKLLDADGKTVDLFAY